MKVGTKLVDGKWVAAPSKRGYAQRALQIIRDYGPIPTEDIILEMKARGYKRTPSIHQLAQYLVQLSVPHKMVLMETLDGRLKRHRVRTALWATDESKLDGLELD